ncbi:protein DpdE [Calidithermus chliarophilus]|uniref:protein DpdE n=1 Tax=Calidithermus chliarophilus TaxID=52023 RepID=UPI0012F6DDA6|nr:protein DpdE [Calidithermus chliarophilus]
MIYDFHIRLGGFAIAEDLPLGPGKILALEDGWAEVEYFESIARQRRVRLRADSLHPQTILPQNRCYVSADRSRWRVGRIVGIPTEGSNSYYVQFPNGQREEVPEQHLYVRWDLPIGDPLEVLICHGYESPYVYQRRHAFVRCLTEQRRASEGLAGLLSSAVELRNHQIRVVRRVLQDPLQRYLLADEVGLGKTVEAGIILRQYLLDNPEGKVAVLCPQTLLDQWCAELQAKFHIEDFPRAEVKILQHERLAELKPGELGMLVVDEAHHLAALAYGEVGERQRYRTLATLVHQTPRLLLLSATPIRRREESFLAMLHLLEPVAYPLEDLEGFRRKLAQREAVSLLFFELEATWDPQTLGETARKLNHLFPQDTRLQRLTAQLQGVLQEHPDEPEARGDILRAIRVHLSETHRVHRRMLRSRRSAHLQHLVRGRRLAGTIPAYSEAERLVEQAVTDWLDHLTQNLPGTESYDLYLLAAGRMLEAAASHPVTLQRFVEERLGGHGPGVLPGEEPFLQAVLRAARAAPPAKESALVDWLRTAGPKTVVFVQDTEVALALARALAEALGPAQVAAYLSVRPEDQAAQLRRFRDDPACRVLVADHSAEEGKNLQFADRAVLFDLPLDPNRLEQRIGRLDRYGRGRAVECWLIGHPEREGLVGAWQEVLVRLGVFEDSIAALQFFLEDTMVECRRAALGGEGELRRFGQRWAAGKEEELSRIAYEDLLDSVEESEEEQGWEDRLYEVEATIESPTRDWVCAVLQFHERREAGASRFTPEPGDKTRPTLVPWQRIRDRFKALSERRTTFSRAAATKNPDLHLLRLGDPFVDALAEYVRWDDRGQNFGWWRFVPSLPENDHRLYFRFDYLVEGDPNPFSDMDLDRAVLRRWIDSFFPPEVLNFWVSSSGEVVHDREVLAWLEQPYDPGLRPRVDWNLSPARRWALDHVAEAHPWEVVCTRTREAVEAALRSLPALRQRIEGATERARARLTVALEQLRLRCDLAPGEAANRQELQRWTELEPRLYKAIAHPSARIDAVGFVVLSGSPIADSATIEE